MLSLKEWTGRVWLLALTAGFAWAGELEDVIDKHVAARGGHDAWQAVKTMKITGTYTGFSIPGSFELIRARPNRLFFDHALGDKRVIWGHDGEMYWQLHGWMSERPMVLSPVDQQVVVQETDFATPFFDYEARGHKVEYLGMSELEGMEGHALKLNRADGGEETWYLDPDTYLEFGRDAPGSDFGAPMRQITWFSDFREVDGLKMPFLLETEFRTRHRVMEIEKVEINPAIDADKFKLPFPAVMAPFRHIVGKWKVKVSSRPNSRAPWQESETTTEVVSLMRGNMFEERIAHAGLQGPVEAIRTLSYDDAKQKYRATIFNDVSYHLNVLEGVLEEGALVMNNVETDTTWSLGRTVHDRMTIKDVTPEGFTVELALSVDGGENWIDYVRLEYSPAK